MKRLMLWLSIFTISLTVAAGDKGNGGGVIKCENDLKLYDFFEAELFEGLKIPNLDLSEEQYTELIFKKILAQRSKSDAENTLMLLRETEALFRSKMEMTNNKLIATFDADKIEVPEGCEFLQAANWNERLNRLRISLPLWKLMKPRERAGLVIHEVLYKIARNKFNEKDSDRIRALVGELFSDKPVVSTNWLLPDIASKCDRVGFLNQGTAFCFDPNISINAKVSVEAVLKNVPHNFSNLMRSCVIELYEGHSTSQRNKD